MVARYTHAMSPLQKRLLLLLAMGLAVQAGINLFCELSDGTPFGGDFIGFWNAAHRVRHGDIAAIYDPDTWRGILSNTTGTISLSWFVYPPFFLFGLWPLGNATYNQAVLVWSLVPLAFYLALIVLLARRSDWEIDADPAGANSWSRAQACAVLVAFSLPFLSASLFSGQTGTLIAVLFLGIVYFWPARPVLAGICIGLLAIKPQMGLLLPFVILASGQWRIAVVAVITVVFLVVLATLWLGTAIWTDYLRMSFLFGHFISGGYDGIRQLALGPYVSLKAVGVPAALAGLLQLAVSVAVVAVIVQAFWRGMSNAQETGKPERELDLRWALLAAGTLLATPYSLSYDTPLLVLSIIPMLARSWRNGWDGVELVSVTVLLTLPYAQLSAAGSHVPFAFLALSFWFVVVYRRFQKEKAAVAGVAVRDPARGQAGQAALPAI